MHPFLRLLAALLLVLSAGLTSAKTVYGRIVGVSDGDTVTLLTPERTQLRIRLTGIDAPEKAQAFGQRSRQHLSDLVFGKEVEADCPKTDRYGRSLCKIVVNGRDANLAQIEAGMAWFYRQYERDLRVADRRSYSQAEVMAKEARVGLWRDADPKPPWEWRRTQRQSK